MFSSTRRLRPGALALIMLAAFSGAPTTAGAFPSGPIRGLADYPSGPVRSTLILLAPGPSDGGAAIVAHENNLAAASRSSVRAGTGSGSR